MATITSRPRKDGQLTWTVKWRLGGKRTAPWQTQPFAAGGGEVAEVNAKAFAARVDAAGMQWPPGWRRNVGDAEEVFADTTLGGVAAAYVADARLRSLSAAAKPKPYTVERYEKSIKKWITPILGSYQVSDICRRDVFNIVEEWHSQLSPKSVHNLHGMLFSILKFARLQGLREDNPAEGTQLPDAKSLRGMRFLTVEEWRTIIDTVPEKHRLLFSTCLGTGARIGEILALRFEDISVIPGTSQISIHIQRAWSQRAVHDRDPLRIRWDEGENNSWCLSLPKGGRERVIVADGEVAAELLRLKDSVGDDERLIFLRNSGLPWRYTDLHKEVLRPILRKLPDGIRDFSFHDFRHTHASWALTNGVSVNFISAQLGHQSTAITERVYAKLIRPDGSSAASVAGWQDGRTVAEVIPLERNARRRSSSGRGGL